MGLTFSYKLYFLNMGRITFSKKCPGNLILQVVWFLVVLGENLDF